MPKQNLHIIKNSVIAFAMTLFFTCKNNLKDVNKIGISANEPVGVSDSINVKYTDSGRLSANLISPKMYDFSNRDFSYSEFPRGNVIAATPTKDTLYAEQLYYDQTKEWLFTNLPATYRSQDYVTSGIGFDSDKDFNKAEVLGVTGQFAVTD